MCDMHHWLRDGRPCPRETPPRGQTLTDQDMTTIRLNKTLAIRPLVQHLKAAAQHELRTIEVAAL